MFCRICGSSLDGVANFCSNCGAQLPGSGVDNTPRQNASQYSSGSLIGFSPKINDPAFAGYVKHSNQWSSLFSIIIAAAAIIGFYIYGEKGSEMDNPEALYIGFVIGGMFLLIALGQILRRISSKTWDGQVIDKKSFSARDIDDDGISTSHMQYTIFIRRDDGKIIKLRSRDLPGMFDYFNIGDRVRHHGKLKTFEKYDKSHDAIIFCNACGSQNDIANDKCRRCKCPLLK